MSAGGTTHNAILGCLLGGAVGDALGLPSEGLSRRRVAARWKDLRLGRSGQAAAASGEPRTCAGASQMGENGVIFSDGIEQDYAELTSGTRATITLARRKGRVVV
jgi:hypothetical protein